MERGFERLKNKGGEVMGEAGFFFFFLMGGSDCCMMMECDTCTFSQGSALSLASHHIAGTLTCFKGKGKGGGGGGR